MRGSRPWANFPSFSGWRLSIATFGESPNRRLSNISRFSHPPIQRPLPSVVPKVHRSSRFGVFLPSEQRFMHIGYVISRYPAVSHTFIQREVLGLRKLGWTVTTFSIRRVAKKELLTDSDRSEA